MKKQILLLAMMLLPMVAGQRMPLSPIFIMRLSEQPQTLHFFIGDGALFRFVIDGKKQQFALPSLDDDVSGI